MRNMIRVLLVFLVEIVTLYCSVDIVFLKGIPRLGQNNYSDNYFSCRAVGSELQWVINRVPTNIYSAGSVAKVYTNTTPDFNFTTTVLSSKLTPQGEQQYTFDSVLIVSCYNKCNLVVVCTNGPLSETVTNRNILSSVMNKTNNSNIYLEHILTQRNIIREPRNTSIFVCGVNNNYMAWHINGNTYGFSTSEKIGNELKTLQEHDASTVNYQAILIGMEPYRIVTIIFVVDNSEVSIMCGYDQMELQLSTRQRIAVSTDTPMSENQSEETVTTLLNSMTTEDMEEPSIMSYTVIIIAVASLIGLIILLCFLAISIHTIRASIYRRREGEEISCGDININCRSLFKDGYCCGFPMNSITLRTPDCTTRRCQIQETSMVENQSDIRPETGPNNDTQQTESSPADVTSNLTESSQSSSPPNANSVEGESNVQSSTSPSVTTTASGSNIQTNTSPTGTTTGGSNIQPNISPAETTTSVSNIQLNTPPAGTTTTSGSNIQPNTSPAGSTTSGSNIQLNTSPAGTTISGAGIQQNTSPLSVGKTSVSMQHSLLPSSRCESTESDTSHSESAETSPTESEDAEEIAEIQPRIETSTHQSAQQSTLPQTSDGELVVSLMKCKPAQNKLFMPPMLQYDDHAKSSLTLQLPTNSTFSDEFMKISSRELQIIMLLRDKDEKIDESASSETEDHKELIGRFRTLSQMEELPLQSKKSSPVLTLALQDKDEHVD